MDLHKVLFGNSQEKKSENAAADDNIKIAVAALLIEMACIDDEFDDREERLILETLKSKFSLTDEDAASLTKQAHTARKESIDLYHFTKQINTNFSQEEKIQMMDMLWSIVYADGRLDGHEDYLIHTLTNMLNLDHMDMIDAKFRASKNNLS